MYIASKPEKKARTVSTNPLGWRVVRGPCSHDRLLFDAPKGCSFYRLVLVGDVRTVW